MFKFGLLATFMRAIKKPIETLNNWLFYLELKAVNRYMVSKNLWRADADRVISVNKPEEEAKTFTILKAIKSGRRYSRTNGGWYFESEDDR